MIKIKKFLPRTLFGRSLMIIVTPVLLIQIIAMVVFFDRHWSKMTTRLSYAVSGEVALIVQDWRNADTNSERQRLEDRIFEHLSYELSFQPGLALADVKYRRSFNVWEPFVEGKLRHELDGQLTQDFLLNLDFENKMIFVFVALPEGVLKIAFPQRRLFSSSGYIFLLWLVGSSLVLLLIAVMFMRNQVRPIRKLAAAAGLFGKGRDVVTFKPEGAREVRQAGQAFIDMRRRIKRQIEQRTAMLAGVSHDLRTPLTRIKLQLAMIDQTPDVMAMKDDIHLMEKMIAGYLDFVRGEDAEDVQMTNMSDLISRLSLTMSGETLQVHTKAAENLMIEIRPLAFERCLSNLIKNAEKYAKNLWIHAEIDENRLKVIVEDDGPGIPPDKREDVFKPFYREDSARNISSGSVGLGLTIAMDVVHRHGGSIALDESQDHGGLKVSIRLPL